MSAHDDIAQAIVLGQFNVMGKVAINLASQALGTDLGDDPGAITITGADEGTVERLVEEYSRITGPLGVRMCYSAAAPVLKQHPSVTIPSFATFG